MWISEALAIYSGRLVLYNPTLRCLTILSPSPPPPLQASDPCHSEHEDDHALMVSMEQDEREPALVHTGLYCFPGNANSGD